MLSESPNHCKRLKQMEIVLLVRHIRLHDITSIECAKTPDEPVFFKKSLLTHR